MRVKTGTVRHAHHHKVLSRTKGMRMTKGRLYKVSKEADLHAGQYAFAGRKKRKRDFRSLWIQRINAGLTSLPKPQSYSKFINLLKKQEVKLNRKILADLAANDWETFKQIAEEAAK